jgi:hypothetical protein
MSLSIGQLSIGDGDTERALRDALGELGVPAGEDWQVSVSPSSAAGAWEVALQGPPRLKSEHIDWEIVHRADGTRYRKLFHKAERDPRFLKRALRKLLWESIQFRENPIWSVDPILAEAFEKAAWNQLRYEEMKPVQVRFGVWREGPDGMKFVCKVEYASASDRPWTWWSSLVRTPDDLHHELQKALVSRRKRRAAQALAAKSAAARLARRARIAAAEAAATAKAVATITPLPRPAEQRASA